MYRATHATLRRDVALKVLPAGLSDDADRLMRFQREARALAAIDHPAIVTVYSVEQAALPGASQPGIHFLTMQLVEGESSTR